MVIINSVFANSLVYNKHQPFPSILVRLRGTLMVFCPNLYVKHVLIDWIDLDLICRSGCNHCSDNNTLFGAVLC